ncbi:LPXTG cell wall anchor domain-containing protein [Marinilactibacillus kalidii]|uniref:LPXTG cell wall anchor domain-containing protein n=1 Tax=Marinilactibacillus kalidii TaxID=2820274 RepID=UPI001ABE3D8A
MNDPNPAPPTGAIPLPPTSFTPANIPSGKLPQTSSSDYKYWIWIGMILVIFSLVILYRSFKEDRMGTKNRRI